MSNSILNFNDVILIKKSIATNKRLLLGVMLSLLGSVLITSCSDDDSDTIETIQQETPDSGTTDPETPDSGTTDPETPDPEIPDPETPDPEIPDPETPDPEIPDPETSPFSFSDVFEGDDFQVDNDSEGAHNWSAEKYDENPVDNGFDIRDYIYVSEAKLILECPVSGEDDRRRAEYRDQVDIDLNDAHSMDFTFDIKNYDNISELIMAQLHNDNSAANRPYITILTEEGNIRLQRTDAPTGSSSERASQTIPFRSTDRYRITIETEVGNRAIFARIMNLSSDEQAENTFDFATDWNDLDGDFYWKFGAYMPDGGSTNTQMRVESIEILGQ